MHLHAGIYDKEKNRAPLNFCVKRNNYISISLYLKLVRTPLNVLLHGF